MSKVGPFFKVFGSKWQSAKHYPKPREAIHEWFAGGAGYSCNYYDRKITLVEKHSEVFQLWHWLIHTATQSDILTIPINIPEGTPIRSLGLAEGQQLLLKWWQRTNNYSMKDGSWTISPWGNKPGQWTASTRSRISEEVTAIKHWKIESPGTYKWFAKDNAHQVTCFVDPPLINLTTNTAVLH